MGPDEEAAAAGAAPAAAILREKSAFVSLIPSVSHGRAADLAGVTADADPKAPPVVAEADDTGADGKANPAPVVAGAPNTGAAEAVDDGLVSPKLRPLTADPKAPPVVAEAADAGADGGATDATVETGAPNTGADEAVDDGLVSPKLRPLIPNADAGAGADEAVEDGLVSPKLRPLIPNAGAGAEAPAGAAAAAPKACKPPPPPPPKFKPAADAAPTADEVDAATSAAPNPNPGAAPNAAAPPPPKAPGAAAMAPTADEVDAAKPPTPPPIFALLGDQDALEAPVEDKAPAFGPVESEAAGLEPFVGTEENPEIPDDGTVALLPGSPFGIVLAAPDVDTFVSGAGVTTPTGTPPNMFTNCAELSPPPEGILKLKQKVGPLPLFGVFASLPSLMLSAVVFDVAPGTGEQSMRLKLKINVAPAPARNERDLGCWSRLSICPSRSQQWDQKGRGRHDFSRAEAHLPDFPSKNKNMEFQKK